MTRLARRLYNTGTIVRATSTHRKKGRDMRPSAFAPLLALLPCLALPVPPARAGDLDPKSVLEAIDFTSEEIATAKAGGIVRRSVEASNPRELTAAMAFIVPAKPARIVAEARAGLGTKIDPNTISWGKVEGPATEAAFAKLALEPDGKKRARRYAEAEPGDDLNLSRKEIAAFHALGSDASVADVESAVRKALAARVESYRSKGLDGIAAYARSKSDERSVAGDLRSATLSLEKLKERVPGTVAFLENYPKGRPAGTEEFVEWSQIEAHGVPTIVLTHRLYIPEGESWLALQRQFYVSEGYNCEQAVALFLPVQKGTAVIYLNRTSTDQVAGFGGGAKRRIGSKVLASQLEDLAKKYQKEAGQ
jgi:hypothetical protein